MTKSAVGVALALTLTACAASDDRSDAAPSSDGGSHGDEGVDAVPLDEPTVFPPCEPTIESLRANVFQIACGGAECHGEGTPAWDLLLVDPGAEDLLVGVRAYSCPGWLRVTPGSLEKSFLYQKVSLATPPCGHRMPWGGTPLPAETQACIAGWILSLPADAGAANDAASDAGDGAHASDASDADKMRDGGLE